MNYKYLLQCGSTAVVLVYHLPTFYVINVLVHLGECRITGKCDTRLFEDGRRKN